MFTIDQTHIEALCPELAQLLAAELAAGNTVLQTNHGFPRPDSISVGLAQEFKTNPDPLPPGVVYRPVNDPHWWKAEYFHEPSGHLLTCSF